MTKPQRFGLALWAILGAASPLLLAQADRINSRIDTDKSVVLTGRVHRLANAKNDAGPVASSFPITGITLMMKPSSAQQEDLNQVLAAQQDPASPSFRQWFTPEQYADRFGVSAGDMAKVTAWLKSQGFSVDYAARARNYVSFSGTAQQVNSAFQTQIHSYVVNGETHYANATDPSIPAALAGLGSTIRGLNNFRLKPHIRKAQPKMHLSGVGTVVGPNDFANIYDVAALYNEGITGAGQKIVVVGQSEIKTADISNFRSYTGLAANPPQLVLVPQGAAYPDGGNPGFSEGDWTESDLDIEWSGAVARNATIILVYSGDVWTSAQFAVDNNLAPVLSMSYGSCEEFDLVDLASERTTVQEANAEGITWLAASGDSGAADCDDNNPPNENPPSVAEGGLAVDAPGSIPEVTSMGGSQFNEGSVINYWGTGTASGYIPETVWNTIAVEGIIGGGGGGASVYFTQPPWQSNLGLNDGMRHVPDLSSASSDYHDPFFIYTSDPSFAPPDETAVGGTSCAAPSMAGIVALLNQYLKTSGLGNINPTLYRLAQTQSTAFHDIQIGNNIEPCADSPDCVNGFLGWSAMQGYDSASGLGSVDAYNLVHAWNTALAAQAQVVATLDQNPVYETGTSSNLWTFQLTLNEEAGIAATLTGLSINGTSFTAQQILALFNNVTAIPANGSISANYGLRNLDVSNGPVPVVFNFSFSGAGGTWNTTMTVPFAGVQPVFTVGGFSNAASGQVAFTPGQLISVYGTGLGNFAQAATITPLPEYMSGVEVEFYDEAGNYYPAPLLYVSPNQVNLQIPWEFPAEQNVTLSIGNPYTYQTQFFTLSKAAPGIFLYGDTSPVRSPIGSGSAKVGQEVAIYVTGVGNVSIDPNDGSTPLANSNPAPTQAVSVTVGGVAAAQPFAYIGMPNWSVGVTQINFTIPSGVGTGSQPVVVTVGGVASYPANIAITQ